MPLLFDAIYLLILLILSPWLLCRAVRTGRYRRGLREKIFGLKRDLQPGAVWFHGVSVGEVHLLRQVVATFRRRRPDLVCVVSTTTDTGFEEAKKAFPDLFVFPFPFDFSWAIRRTLRTLRPALIVLAESEIWPNFLLGARRRQVPVAIINARMSPRSYARWHRLGWLGRWLWRLFDLLATQNNDYAAKLRALGAPTDRVVVTGSVKFDGAQTDRANPRTQALGRLLAVQPEDTIWIAGSTQAPEEEIVLAIYRQAVKFYPNLRLFLVPRQRDRFDEVARMPEKLGQPFVRRSHFSEAQPIQQSDNRIVLVDTIGELGPLWGLANLAFVGGSLDGRRGGQNMIEPAAFGAPVTFGPHVWNFRDTATRLVEAGGACQVADAKELAKVTLRLLADAAERSQMGNAARAFVLHQQGATERTVALLDDLLVTHAVNRAA
jgi:3-deoxy-D-manno-octulosonic-acid transferase